MMSILELPDEILYHLLTYTEDTDLQTLAITCKRLRSITMDGPLRRHILLKRTPARLQFYLSDRPSRDTLAKQNILRGIHIRQHIHEGQYIGGPAAVRSYHISCRLERQMVSIRISKKLKSRPDWTELVERGLIPEEMFVKEEEVEAKRKWKTYQENQKHKCQQSDEQEAREPSIFAPQQEQSRSRGVHPLDMDMMDHNPSFAGLSVQHPGQVLPEQQDHTRPSSSSYLTGDTRASIQPRRQKKSISMVLVPKIELLRKAMDRDRLSRLVQKRPSPLEMNQSSKTATVLHAYHLIAFSTTSPDLVPLTAQLSFLLKGEKLSHWLYRRPSLAVILNERGILKTEVRTAWMVCPGVTKKVRFYEGLIQERRRRDFDQQQLLAQTQHQHPYQHQQHPHNNHQSRLQGQLQHLQQQHLSHTTAVA